MVTSAETRNQIKAPNFAINWTIGQKTVEVVNSLTGKTINGKVSRITKQAFFTKYSDLIKRLPNVQNRVVRGDYGETKMSVRDYQVSTWIVVVVWSFLYFFRSLTVTVLETRFSSIQRSLKVVLCNWLHLNLGSVQ